MIGAYPCSRRYSQVFANFRRRSKRERALISTSRKGLAGGGGSEGDLTGKVTFAMQISKHGDDLAITDSDCNGDRLG
jgi:hypothetical protein